MFLHIRTTLELGTNNSGRQSVAWKSGGTNEQMTMFFLLHDALSGCSIY